MNTYTPAPWVLLPDSNGWTLHANGQDITAEAFDATEADARLIANAPALAEALAWALDQIDDDPDPDHRAALDYAHGVLNRALNQL